MAETTQETPEPEPTIVDRPFGQLHDYPVSVRWEVTRRHPYYLMFWHDVLRFRQNPPVNRPDQAQLGYAQSLMLGSIGVTGEPVDPAIDFAKLIGGETDPAFLSGSVQPVTLRGVVAMLIRGLPAAERESVASLLMSVDIKQTGSLDNTEIRKQTALAELGRIASGARLMPRHPPLLHPPRGLPEVDRERRGGSSPTLEGSEKLADEQGPYGQLG